MLRRIFKHLLGSSWNSTTEYWQPLVHISFYLFGLCVFVFVFFLNCVKWMHAAHHRRKISLSIPSMVFWDEDEEGGGMVLLLTTRAWGLISLHQLSMGEN